MKLLRACVLSLVLSVGWITGCTTTANGPQGSVEFGRIRALDQVTTAPRVLTPPQPMYPPAFLQSRIEGTAVLSFVVEYNGRLRDVKLVEASDPAFADAAVKSLNRASFAPARRGLRPVDCTMEMTFIFRIPL